MTTKHIIELDTIFLMIVFTIVGVVFAMYYNHKPNVRSSFFLPSTQEIQSPTSIITPTLISTPKVETFSQISPDGGKNLVMTVTNKDTEKIYEFTTSDNTDSNQQLIYSATLPNTEKMSIPFNTWSPGNRYVFLQHNTSSTSAALVMKANGQPFREDEQYSNITDLFTTKDTGNIYQETTGWASETLLILNTTQPDGSKGPSYWFEVPSKAIIQLSTDF